MIKTLATAADLNAPKEEASPGHFVSATVQRRWVGEASDEVISAWLRSKGLEKAHVHVYRIQKARHETMYNRTVTA